MIQSLSSLRYTELLTIRRLRVGQLQWIRFVWFEHRVRKVTLDPTSSIDRLRTQKIYQLSIIFSTIISILEWPEEQVKS
jgi:hypothetical protein